VVTGQRHILGDEILSECESKGSGKNQRRNRPNVIGGIDFKVRTGVDEGDELKPVASYPLERVDTSRLDSLTEHLCDWPAARLTAS
jgi:hypothetical protein